MENLNLENEEEKKLETDQGFEPDVELVKSDGSALKTKKHDVEEDFFDDTEGQLMVDLYQTPDEIILETPVAGVKPEDLDIAITNESVTIKGKREKERRVKDEDYFYQECYWGRFSRSIVLPQEVDAEKAEAAIKAGVLTIKLPKLNRQRTKKIRIRYEE
ncbi:MAG: Hsp20/alpha crystallin family protein [Candidatus Harrisonbacteria bacterium]|nr:Hsp20/alpha crystallin family protein [Candidatus Harrisonbacteria bacterium]